LQNPGLSFTDDGVFDFVQRGHESIHVADIDLMIPVGRQRPAGQEANIRALAANERTLFPDSMQA
jgi:hypothetical protein